MKYYFSISICLFFLCLTTAVRAGSFQSPVSDSIPPAASKPNDWDNAVEAVHLAGEARVMRDSFTQKFDLVVAQRGAVQRALEKAQADTTLKVEQLTSLKNELKEALKKEKEAEKNLKRAKSTAEFSELVANMDARQQKAQLPKSRKQVQQLKNVLYMEQLAAEPKPEKEETKKEESGQPVTAVASETPVQVDSSSVAAKDAASSADKRRPKTKTVQQPKTSFKTYVMAEDVMINPPIPPCVLASNVRDEFSGEVRREMPRSEIFQYTNQALRKVYTDKAHTIGEVSLLSIGLNAALHLSLRINDPNVRRSQGTLQKGGVAVLKFMDGYSITLNNVRADEGATDPEGKFVTFQAEFPIDRVTVKKLRNTELDKIRLAWTNGYEEYDVQQVDQLMRQAKCLFE